MDLGLLDMPDAGSHGHQPGRVPKKFDPCFDVALHRFVNGSIINGAGGPRCPDLDEAIARPIAERAERLPGRRGHRASELRCVGSGLSESLHQPRPSDVVEHRVRDEVRFERRSREDDRSEVPIPLVDAIGVMEEDEATGKWVTVING